MVSIFVCALLAICMSSLEKYLFRSSALFFFLVGMFVFFILSCMSCLCILEINHLLITSFEFFYGFLCWAEALSFNYVCLFYFCFYFHYSKRWIKKDIATTYAKGCSAFFSLCFIVFGLTFRSLIHFKFIFAYGIRECSVF